MITLSLWQIVVLALPVLYYDTAVPRNRARIIALHARVSHSGAFFVTNCSYVENKIKKKASTGVAAGSLSAAKVKVRSDEVTTSSVELAQFVRVTLVPAV